ncbi:MAG: Holliday junction resolvase RuvX [Limnothrix sp.]
MPKIAALALDVGRKRIGVAGCDGLGLLATGLDTIHRTSSEADLAAIRQWVEKRAATVLVVGLPFMMDGNIGKQAKITQKFAQRISRDLGLPLEYVDERLTSVEAETQLTARKKYFRHNKGLVDKEAAQIILQQWLDQKRSENKL